MRWRPRLTRTSGGSSVRTAILGVGSAWRTISPCASSRPWATMGRSLNATWVPGPASRSPAGSTTSGAMAACSMPRRSGEVRRTSPRSPHLSPELRNPFGKLEDHARAVRGVRSRGLALVHDPGVGKIGNARTAAATLIVAHDVPPLGPVHVTVAVGKGRVALIDKPIMPNSQDVPDLVRNRHGRGGARVMHDEEGLIRIRSYPR